MLSPLVKECLASEKELHQLGQKSWYSLVSNLITNFGTNDMHTYFRKRDIGALVTNYATLHKNYAMQLIRGDNNTNGNKLRTYKHIKDNFEIEYYLMSPTLTWKEKRHIAKIRIGDHNLNIETGRHKRPKVPIEERKCSKCNKVENEIHFITECSLYNDLRDNYIANLINVCDSQEQKFIFLFTSKKDELLKCLAKYIEQAFEVRKEFTNKKD